jgi:hypothetical protein
LNIVVVCMRLCSQFLLLFQGLSWSENCAFASE